MMRSLLLALVFAAACSQTPPPVVSGGPGGPPTGGPTGGPTPAPGIDSGTTIDASAPTDGGSSGDGGNACQLLTSCCPIQLDQTGCLDIVAQGNDSACRSAFNAYSSAGSC